MDTSDACVVFLSKNGIGRWQKEEVRVAIAGWVQRRRPRVIPVLLLGACVSEEESPLFLERFLRVEFNKHVKEEENMQLPIWAALATGTGPEVDKKSKKVCILSLMEFSKE